MLFIGRPQRRMGITVRMADFFVSSQIEIKRPSFSVSLSVVFFAIFETQPHLLCIGSKCFHFSANVSSANVSSAKWRIFKWDCYRKAPAERRPIKLDPKSIVPDVERWMLADAIAGAPSPILVTVALNKWTRFAVIISCVEAAAVAHLLVSRDPRFTADPNKNKKRDAIRALKNDQGNFISIVDIVFLFNQRPAFTQRIFESPSVQWATRR